MNRKRSRAREVAMQLLFQHDLNPTVQRQAIESFTRERLNGEADLERFALGLYDGVRERAEAIDERLGRAAENWRVARMAVVDRNVLRLGAFELLHVSGTPGNVVLDEAIEMARRYGSAGSGAFVNGVLDRLYRERGQEAGVSPDEGALRSEDSSSRAGARPPSPRQLNERRPDA
jgi:N utilization substance protein B